MAMNMIQTFVSGIVMIGLLGGCRHGDANKSAAEEGLTAGSSSPYAAWPVSRLNDPTFFPIMVWAQEPSLAARYKELGINTYLSLWEGPTEAQLAALAAQGMFAICTQNKVGLAHLDDPTILAWMHGDEPDNRQERTDKPIPVKKIVDDYTAMVARDPSRPVVINLGQGVANEAFTGRAIGYDQYPEYIRGADILSYDVYPVANLKYSEPGPDGKPRTRYRDDGGELLWYVAKGVDRLKEWGGGKPVWNVLECTAISNPRDRKVTPHQLRAEVWMSIVHGSRGICWFVHDFREGHKDVAALLSDPVTMQAVRENNLLITRLAPVINAPETTGLVEINSARGVPIDVMTKRYSGALYLIAVAMRNQPTGVTFTIRDSAFANARVEVIGEDRSLKADGGRFSDTFSGFDVRLYKISRP